MLISTWWGVLILVLASIIIWLTLSVIFYKKFFKRFYDVFFSLIFMPFFLLLCIPVAIIIKAQDKGPVFYNGKRLGRNGKTFKMFKFRTMFVNAPDIRLEDGSTFNSSNDPRVTRIGRFLRKTSIDEIPQLLNIFLGQMSFIGPRPDLPEAIDILTDDEKLKLKVRPGVTGYSQAYVRNSVAWKQRLKYDCAYEKKLSFFFDLHIIFATVKIVLLRKNLYSDEINKETVAEIDIIGTEKKEGDELNILTDNIETDIVNNTANTETDIEPKTVQNGTANVLTEASDENN